MQQSISVSIANVLRPFSTVPPFWKPFHDARALRGSLSRGEETNHPDLDRSFTLFVSRIVSKPECDTRCLAFERPFSAHLLHLLGGVTASGERRMQPCKRFELTWATVLGWWDSQSLSKDSSRFVQVPSGSRVPGQREWHKAQDWRLGWLRCRSPSCCRACNESCRMEGNAT